MPKYLLKITKRKWDKLNFPWLGPDQIQADPLGDLRISEGALSVWHIEDDMSNIDLVVTAIAATREKFDKLEYGLFDQKILDELGLSLQFTLGDTPVDDANSWHRDLIHLTVDKASNLATAIFHTFEKQRLLENQIQTLIINAAKNRQINLERVKTSMKQKILASQS